MSDQVTNEELSGALYAEALKFKSYVTIFTILTLIGSIALGWVAAQETSCSMGYSNLVCSTETDAATLIIVGATAFVAGMLFVLPLRGLATMLTGTARLLAGPESGRRAGPF